MSPSAIDLLQQRDRRLRDKLRRELGSDVLAALSDASVVEVMLNADGELWVERLGSGVALLGGTMSRSQAENLLGTVAALAETEVNEERPLLEVELPFDGSRFHGVVPPVSSGPLFAIRKRAVRVHTLDDYVVEGILAPAVRDALRAALGRRANIVICGGTGSGKTTLANALLREAVERVRRRSGRTRTDSGIYVNSGPDGPQRARCRAAWVRSKRRICARGPTSRAGAS